MQPWKRWTKSQPGWATSWQSVDIDEHADLLARHSEEVPVLLIDGKVRDFWVIDPQRLESLLSN